MEGQRHTYLLVKKEVVVLLLRMIRMKRKEKKEEKGRGERAGVQVLILESKSMAFSLALIKLMFS